MSRINVPKEWDRELKLKIEWLSDTQKDRLLKLLILEKNERENEEAEQANKLKINTNAILKDLRENHVKIEENAKIIWYKWKKVHIDLPAVWNFEWYKFDYFVSDKQIRKDTFESNPELKKRSYSINEVSKLFQAMNRYMLELWGGNDGDEEGDIDELEYRETAKNIYSITWLRNWYWLKNKEILYNKNFILSPHHARWSCYIGYDNIDWIEDNRKANLFLKLSE